MVYIIILNWNGWQDTVACLQSLTATKGVDYRVIVCDNGSTDDSLEKIQQWAKTELDVPQPEHQRLARLTAGLTPVSCQRLSRHRLQSQIENNKVVAADDWLTIIENQANLGFAAGNNPGIRYALHQKDMTHAWLLNNDTLVEPDCLLKMLRRLEAENSPAICGSRVMFYDDPSVIQALGGNKFNKWTGNASPSLGRYWPEKQQRNPADIEKALDYISGCSMLIPREFIEDIGLMEESYFLYYEEIDWAVRAKDKYKAVYADDAVLYHKEGGSIGSASLDTRPSALSEFYCFRNKLRFTRKHFPVCLLSCYLVTLMQVLNRWRRGYWSSGWLILMILFGKERFGA